MKRSQCHRAAWGNKALMLCAIVLTASLAFAGSRKLSRELENVQPGSTIDVIVQYKQVPTEAHYQRMKGRGGLEKARLHSIKAAAFSLPVSALRDLDADPDVAYVSPDRPVGSTASTPDFYDTAVNAAYGWGLGYDGTGIGVAVIDSGINTSGMKDLNKWASNSKRVVYSQSFVPGDLMGTALTWRA
jgi:serine protease AprX